MERGRFRWAWVLLEQEGWATEPTGGLKVLGSNGASAKVSRVDSCLDVVPLVRVGHVEDILDS